MEKKSFHDGMGSDTVGKRLNNLEKNTDNLFSYLCLPKTSPWTSIPELHDQNMTSGLWHRIFLILK